MKLLSIFHIFLGINFAHGLNILAIFPLSMKSHHAIGFSIIKSLLDVGHNVTALSTIKPDKPIANYRVVPIPDAMKQFQEQEPNPLEYANFPTIISMLMMPKFGSDMVNLVMQSDELKELLKSDDKYDICIMEIFGDEALLGIPEKFNCALLFYITLDCFLWSDSFAGNQSPSSYVPNLYLHYTDNMTFGERLWNEFVGLLDKTLYYGYHIPHQRNLYNKYFPNAKRSFDEMYKNSSITFINHHVSHSYPRPHMPTQIEIGGIHVQPAKNLPEDLQKFMDSATDGVILFSMGSYIDGTDWPVEKREAFIGAFKKLKQKIIWRYSNETLPNNPGNIKISSWLPQRDILAHKNLKLFITHGGLLGTTEAIVEGVPVLGLPIFGDQKMNIAKVASRGYGLQLNYNDITEETMSYSINELLNNPKYRETSIKVSKTFNDRELTPQETVVYWTEFVARHHGAKHLQARSTKLSYFEFNSFDTFAVIILIFLIIIYIDFVILKKIIRKFLRVTKPKTA